MMPLGTLAPTFSLRDVVTDRMVSLPDKPAVATLIAFICNHCPYVVHIIPEFVGLASEMQRRGVRVIAISANDPVAYPEDSPEQMQQFAAMHAFTFPYLFDCEQTIVRAYGAECTPDLYVFDADLRCAYRGRFDESTPGNGKPVTGDELREALESILNGQPVSEEQYPSIGCSIKYRDTSS